MFSRKVLTVALLCCVPALVYAQNQPQPGRRQPGRQQNAQPVTIEGTIVNAARGMIAVADAEDRQWRVAVPADAEISVTGTATADFLRSGLFVELQAELNDRGEIQGAIGELTIVTPSDDRPIGLSPVGATAGENGFGGEGEKKPGGKAGNKRGVAAGTYRIVGRLNVARGGKLSVQAGRGMAKFELAEEPKINVDVADFSIVAQGDKISIEGMMMPNQPGLARAGKVRIELAGPLTGGKKKHPAKSTPKRPPRPPKHDGPPPADDE